MEEVWRDRCRRYLARGHFLHADINEWVFLTSCRKSSLNAEFIRTVVVLVSKHTSADLGVSNQLLTVLGLVLGLVISFRTSSAYER